MAKRTSQKRPSKAKKPAASKAAAKKAAAPKKAASRSSRAAPRRVRAPASEPAIEAPRPPVLEAEPVLADEPTPGPRALPSGEPAGRVMPFEIDPKRLEEGLRKLQGEMAHWANKGRYTRVRFKFRGKQLLPDLPLAAVVAAEGLTFYWGGILRVLIANVVGGSVFQVELVNDAEKRVQAGKEALLSGDVDQALELFREAVSMDRDLASAHLNVGVALKLRGDRDGALASFEKAKEKDPEGPVGAEAERLAAPLRPQG
ncbi:tetratricopeptide repeat protein [Corallococcus macrosporus]|uniref:TPR repeat-containing protein n=1 Tax=Myxococcus fulvus (strain ATCC BAA-855 / HW-1) TaxID=483219 RepID=F8CNK0_MYXFH|nr:tetratricopeptide repeat protein [Corallococcus macrosporus]AEI62917.1 TPR repeat-containing protein [Corallococcus macrosporus]